MRIALVIFFIVVDALAVKAQSFFISKAFCNEKENPVGIALNDIAFSWQMDAAQRNVTQTAYRICVVSDKKMLGKNNADMWTSQWIQSSQSLHVSYKGKALQPATKYYWYIEVKDNYGHYAKKGEQYFVTALKPADWGKAQWIGYEEMPDSNYTYPGIHQPDAKRKLGNGLKQRTIVPLFRKNFIISKPIAEAYVFVTGIGQYELSINGRKAGNSFLSPGWTDYEKRVLYNTYDVTALLQKGENVIGAIVGNGFYHINRERYYKLAIALGNPKLICQLTIRYIDGSSSVIVSDESWKTTVSPITFSSIYGGEDYDATLEKKGWNTAGALPSDEWKQAIVVKSPKGKLLPEEDYPVTVRKELQVQKISKPDSVYVYDFGQNMSGIIRLQVKGKKGQVVTLIPAELLNDQQHANQNATGKPYYFSYTLKGEGVETWQPLFSYYGFRYVQVEGAHPDSVHEEGASIISLTALHTFNSSPVAGSFECSSPLFNQINQLIRWAITSNFQSVLTDCPHREKLSWLEQDYLMGGSVHFNYNIHHLYTKLIHDMMDAQTKEGLVPDVAPEFVFFDDHGFGFRDSPEWGSACVIMPWLLYQWYGDLSSMKEAYPMMQRYVQYLSSKADQNIIDYGLGDWYDLGPQHPGVAQLTPKALTATAIYYYDVVLLSKMADLLHDPVKANKLRLLSDAIKKAFNNTFFNAQTKVYATGSQTSMAMPLCVGLVNETDRQQVFQNLIDSIKANGNRLTTGDIGFHFLVQALQEGGASYLLYNMNNRSDVPGYGYQLSKGATALTESWQALRGVSNNHLMLGHLMEWLYDGLGGINQEYNSIAYEHIKIAPEPVGDISQAKVSYETPYGTVFTQWEKKGNHFTLHLKVPVNTKATVYLPVDTNAVVKEKDKLLKDQAGITLHSPINGKSVIQVGSGDYYFSVVE